MSSCCELLYTYNFIAHFLQYNLPQQSLLLSPPVSHWETQKTHITVILLGFGTPCHFVISPHTIPQTHKEETLVSLSIYYIFLLHLYSLTMEVHVEEKVPWLV